jgi:hypothetical protein
MFQKFMLPPYPTTLHGVTIQKTSTWKTTAVKASKLAYNNNNNNNRKILLLEY